MTFTDRAWHTTESIRAAIDRLPFVLALGDGTLDRDRFTYYLAQDAHYLNGYARALAAAATRADTIDDVAFFAEAAHEAVAVERQLHTRWVPDIASRPPSPTCTAYTSFLLQVAHTDGYPELVAALLPCFWVYADVGTSLLERADLAEHPYADWIALYAGEEFAEATAAARTIVDRVADGAGPATVEAMITAFTVATRYEWMFWDAAWRREEWPV